MNDDIIYKTAIYLFVVKFPEQGDELKRQILSE